MYGKNYASRFAKMIYSLERGSKLHSVPDTTPVDTAPVLLEVRKVKSR